MSNSHSLLHYYTDMFRDDESHTMLIFFHYKCKINYAHGHSMTHPMCALGGVTKAARQ